MTTSNLVPSGSTHNMDDRTALEQSGVAFAAVVRRGTGGSFGRQRSVKLRQLIRRIPTDAAKILHEDESTVAAGQ